MTLTRAGLQEKVVEIVKTQVGKESADIEPARLFTQYGADELDCIEIVMRLEEEFSLEINDADAQNLLSVSAAVRYLEEKLSLEK